jgi:hypothetical protein
MSLCLDGTSIWGEFQLGDMEGVFFMPERPWNITRSSNGRCPFGRRGAERQVDRGYYALKCMGEMISRRRQCRRHILLGYHRRRLRGRRAL